MKASYAAILFLGLALAWTAINKSGVLPFDWYVSLVFIGIASLIYWGPRRRKIAPSLVPWLQWTMLGVVLYILFQLLPLPLPLLGVLSPARAQLARALAPVTKAAFFAPLSVNPPAHLLWFLTILGCLATFFLLRELAFRFIERPALVLLPFLGIALLEAILGLLQVAGGAIEAIGTYNGRDHYVCILEMALPVTIAYGLVVFSRRDDAGGASLIPAIAAVGIWIMAALQLLAILASLSRAGIIDTLLSSLALTLLLGLPRLQSRLKRTLLVTGVLLPMAAALIFASPAALLNRLAGTSTHNEGRFVIWREAMPLTKEFRWFGTGLMGFDPTFLKYQDMANSKRIDFAHNDYLQYWIELGLVGFVPLMACLGGLLWPIARQSWFSRQPERRTLLIGFAGGLLALAVHSFFDFNLYVPANLLAFAWMAALGSVYTFDK